jgi:hypothetical protein
LIAPGRLRAGQMMGSQMMGGGGMTMEVPCPASEEGTQGSCPDNTICNNGKCGTFIPLAAVGESCSDTQCQVCPVLASLTYCNMTTCLSCRFIHHEYLLHVCVELHPTRRYHWSSKAWPIVCRVAASRRSAHTRQSHLSSSWRRMPYLIGDYC